jgi:hypothetical protein
MKGAGMSYPEEPLGPALVIQHTGQVFALSEAPVTIGRAEDNLILLDDPRVAAHHAKIVWHAEPGVFVIWDLGSVEGTFVNEVQVVEAQPLRHGDVLRIGNTVIDVRLAPTGGAGDQGAIGMGAAVVAQTDSEVRETKARSPWLVTVLVIVLGGLAVACCIVLAFALYRGSADTPGVAIQSPTDGVQIVVGSEIILQATASGANDIVVLELAVDDGVVATETSPDSNGTSMLSVSKVWTFRTLGEHVVSAVARTASGETSRVARISVTAVSSAVEVTPATETPTPAPEEPTEIPTPIPTATNTPEPDATIPPPPQVEYFQASPASITAGECTTLQWGAVTFAAEARIDPDVGGVATPGETQVCPGETTVYVLKAAGLGGVTEASTTVSVIGGLPDLTVESILFVPQPSVEGQDTEVQLTIRNIGVGPAGAFDWEWDAGPEGVFDGRIYGLKAGESHIASLLWAPTSSYASLATEARVDVRDEVPESDKGNNRLSVNVRVVEAPVSAETIIINSDGSLDGYWTNGGTGGQGDVFVGNSEVVTGTEPLFSRGFISFDLTDIPAGATIQSVELRFFQQQVEGDPYGKLGNLTLEHVIYGSLDDAAFGIPAMASVQVAQQTAPGEWYTLADGTFVSWVEADLAATRSSLQLRLRFAVELDGDDQGDWIAIAPGGGLQRNRPQLTVTYLP